jgi:cytochrome P450
MLLTSWAPRAGTPFRPNRDLSALLLTMLGRTAFGYAFDTRPELRAPIHRALVTLTSEVVKRHFAPVPYWRLVPGRAVADAQACLAKVVDDIVVHGERRRAAGVAADDLLELLLRAREDGKLTDADVRDEVLNILIAGHETSATAMSWIVAMLAKHPDVQAKARREVDRRLGGRAPTAESLESLPYVTQVIKETMRLYAPVPFSIHRAERDGFVGDVFVPKGTAIDLLSYLAHRDPASWPEPLRFDPDRFASGDIPPHRYFPFLIGPHTCIGMHLAMTELRVVTAMLLQRFELAAHVGELRENIRISLHPAGLEILLRKREELDSLVAEGARISSMRRVAACPYHAQTD